MDGSSSSSSLGSHERLSSRLTVPLQTLPISLWLALAFGLAFLWWKGAGTAAVSPALSWLVLLPLGPPLLLLPAVAFWAAGLNSVATDGTFLFVTLPDGRFATVPLASVISVREWQAIDMRAITLTFDRTTGAGRSLRFLAPTRYSVAQSEPHPITVALREAVEVAQAMTTMPGDTPPLAEWLNEPVAVSG
jgi:hypothetical protein